MSASQVGQIETLDRNFDYVSEIETLLAGREEPLNPKEVRIELEYGENGLERAPELGADDIQIYVDNAVNEIKEKSEKGYLDLAVTLDAESGQEFYRIMD